MIRSMTGYGYATTYFLNGKCSVEIKSLNSKGLDIMLKLPTSSFDRELSIRTECGKHIERGKVSLTVSLDYANEDQKKLMLIVAY